MYKKVLILATLIISLSVLLLFLVKDSVNAAEIEDFGDYTAITFPAGTYFAVMLTNSIDSGVSKVDDLVEAVFPSDMYIGEMTVIPKGSKLIGKILSIESAHQGRNALIRLSFFSIIPANGTGAVPISAILKDKNSDGSIGGQLTEKTKYRVVVHYVEGIGGYGQGIRTGPRSMGQEIYISPGERWTIQLQEPARFIIPK